MPRMEVDPKTAVEIWGIVSVAEKIGRSATGSVDRSDWRPPSPRGNLPVPFMLDMVSLFVGIIALMLVLFASIPFIATAGWLVVPMAAVGLALGLLSGSMTGGGLNLLVILIALAVPVTGS